MIVEEVHDSEPDMECSALVAGLDAVRPEDVGGPDDFKEFLEAILDPAREEHPVMLHWNGGPFDPIGLDEERARFGIENIVRR